MFKKLLSVFKQPESEGKQTAQGENGSSAIVAPMRGTLLPITDVPDPVFAGKMMGDGFAIEPADGEVVSPVRGEIVNVFPTKHAIGILAEDGKEILIHFGIDTVKLNGEGFHVHVKQGDRVKQGQLLMKADVPFIQKHATSAITPIIFTNLKENETVILQKQGHVERGEAEAVIVQ